MNIRALRHFISISFLTIPCWINLKVFTIAVNYCFQLVKPYPLNSHLHLMDQLNAFYLHESLFILFTLWRSNKRLDSLILFKQNILVVMLAYSLRYYLQRSRQSRCVISWFNEYPMSSTFAPLNGALSLSVWARSHIATCFKWERGKSQKVWSSLMLQV